MGFSLFSLSMCLCNQSALISQVIKACFRNVPFVTFDGNSVFCIKLYFVSSAINPCY